MAGGEKYNHKVADYAMKTYSAIYRTECEENQQISTDEAEDIDNLAEFLDTLEDYFKISIPSEIFSTINEIIEDIEASLREKRQKFKTFQD